MQKIDVDGFVKFLENLQVGVPSNVYTKHFEDGEMEAHSFLKIEFNGEEIILYETHYYVTDIIQDTPVAPWQDYAEEVYEGLQHEDEYELFI